MGKSTDQRFGARGFLRVPALIIVCVVVIGLAAGGALIATHRSGNSSAATLAAGNSEVNSKAARARHHHRRTPPTPLTVLAITPAPGTSAVAWQSAVTVHYSEPLAPSTPLPTLKPTVTGSWEQMDPTTLLFAPTEQYVPFAKETVTVPAGSASAGGTVLGHVVTSTFTVAGASILRLQELLAELGYLPVAFTRKGNAAVASRAVPTDTPAFTHLPAAPGITGTTVVPAPGPMATRDFTPSAPGDIELQPLAGKFTWRFSSIPALLASQWTPGAWNEITTGAVMAFEAAHGLDDDGVAGPTVWAALLKAAAARQITTAPYDYVYVSEGDPEFVTVWRDGVNVFTTLANTGIPQEPTQAGTWAVYGHYITATMRGVNPNGSHYVDPGIPWVSYFHGGDALHGYIRAQYGFPQSLGCVEMPYSSAETVFPYTPVGTLVTIE